LPTVWGCLLSHSHFPHPVLIDLDTKPLVSSPPHDGTISGVIRRDVKNEPLGNNHARIHSQLSTVSMLISDGAPDGRIFSDDGSVF